MNYSTRKITKKKKKLLKREIISISSDSSISIIRSFVKFNNNSSKLLNISTNQNQNNCREKRKMKNFTRIILFDFDIKEETEKNFVGKNVSFGRKGKKEKKRNARERGRGRSRG